MNIQNALTHFRRVHHSLILKASSAIGSGNASALDDIVETVGRSSIAKLLASSISNSAKALDDFRAEMEELGPLGKVISGLTLVGAGAMLWVSKDALLVAIAFGLIAWGISIALPAMWQVVERKLPQLISGI